jgi:citrate synthase
MNMNIDPGLQEVVAAATRLSGIDGEAGELIIAGFPLAELAPHATFEETLYLLWNDRLPDAAELRAFQAELAAQRGIPEALCALLQAAQRTDMMDALRMGASALSLDMQATDDARASALRAVAAFPTIVAAAWRLRHGQAPVSPRADLGHAANYLYMLNGTSPTPAQVRALDTYLNTVIDHGLNASTFTARVIISTQSDMISAVVGAIGALKGPLHGGAPGPALDMVFEIGQPENAEPVIRQRLARGERLMGFGHRVYRVRDPRADVLNDAAALFFADGAQAALYALVRHVEQVALHLLHEHRPERRLATNVEFYTALLLHGIGLPADLFSPTFAVSRVGGWTAHAFEQLATRRLIRPASVYTGPRDRVWQPLAQRSTAPGQTA